MTSPYLTIVYRITSPEQPKQLLEAADWTAACHSHALRERDRATSDLIDAQAQRLAAFRTIERLHDQLGTTDDQRQTLLAAAQSTRHHIEGELDALLMGLADAQATSNTRAVLAQLDAAIAQGGTA